MFIARRALILFPTAGLGAYSILSDDTTETVQFKTSPLPVRLARVGSTVATTLFDYQWSLQGLQGDALDNAKDACHERGAQRILKLAFKNGGIYIKLAQHIGMLDHLVPSQYVVTMKNATLDNCPVSTFDNVTKTIEEDLGQDISTLFSQIDEKPIASASIAQVHIATDATSGEKVAVKVQHRGLRETSNVDLNTIEFLVKAVKLFAPNFDYMWLVHEAKDNLPCELDFEIEAANAHRCAQHLNSPRSSVKGRVTVPKIIPSKSSKRVLTMEYIQGVYVTDKKGLSKLGCNPKHLAKIISLTFNDMIFKFGDVHADPHAANMLVRKSPPGSSKGPWQLVLLDHGLYRKLDDTFRLEYASLWKSLIFADVDGIKQSAIEMNAGDAVPLFAGMLTQRPWKEISKQNTGTERLKLSYTKEERSEIQEFAGMHAKEIGWLLAKIPRELLLLLKTNDCLRAVDTELGAGVNNYLITARECNRALVEHRHSQKNTWMLFQRTAAMLDALKLEYRLCLLSLVSYSAPILSKIYRYRNGGNGGGTAVDG